MPQSVIFANPSPDKSATPLADIADADRKAAAWVQSIGGSVRVTVAEQLSDWIRPGGALPDGPLQLHSVFTSDIGTIRNEEELKVLAGLSGLRSINFEEPFPYGDATMQVIGTLIIRKLVNIRY